MSSAHFAASARTIINLQGDGGELCPFGSTVRLVFNGWAARVISLRSRRGCAGSSGGTREDKQRSHWPRWQAHEHSRASPSQQATNIMSANFERHRQAWTPSEISKLGLLVGKGMSLKSIAKALTRSEESVKKRAKIDKLKIAKAR